LRERATTLKEMAEQAAFLYAEFEDYEEKAAAKQLKAGAREPLTELRTRLAEIEPWEPATLQGVIQSVVDDLEVGFGKVGQPLRVALTGRGAAPGNDQVLALLGRERSLARIDRAISFIDQRIAAAR
ncbi:MAG: glutamate--tRNA ligase, partial [Pseudomonadota bacterium]